MSKKRLFVAVDLPTEVKQEVAALVAPLQATTVEITWVEEGNYHFTLKFIGVVDEKEIPRISEALRSVAAHTERFPLFLGTLAILPERGPARVVYVEVGGGEEEMNTAAFEIEEALASVGVNKQDKQFLAHLTVGRVKHDKGLDELKALVQRSRGIAREVGVGEFVLFESELTHAGPTYRVVERFSLKGH